MLTGTSGAGEVWQLDRFSGPFRKTRGKTYFFLSFLVNGESCGSRNL